jgi:hypothetical protein
MEVFLIYANDEQFLDFSNAEIRKRQYSLFTETMSGFYLLNEDFGGLDPEKDQDVFGMIYPFFASLFSAMFSN